ncbi:MAG: glycine cleavage system protein GcvH [bacterium]
MQVPGNLRYSKEHEWIDASNPAEASVGITDYAQSHLGDVVYLEIQVKAGDTLAKDQTFATVESVKAVSEIYAPVAGTVVAVNSGLVDAPERINSDPYGDAWLVKIEVTGAGEVDALMSADAYQAFVEAETNA